MLNSLSLSLSLSLLFLFPFIRITFLFLLLYYHHFPSFYFSFYDSHQATGRQDCYCTTRTHYSYCRREGPATFSETFLSGPPRSGLSALSTASSSSTKTLETFSSQRSLKNASGAPAVIRRSVNASKLRLLELAVRLKRGAGISLGSGLGVTGALSGAGEGSSIS